MQAEPFICLQLCRPPPPSPSHFPVHPHSFPVPPTISLSPPPTPLYSPPATPAPTAHSVTPTLLPILSPGAPTPPAPPTPYPLPVAKSSNIIQQNPLPDDPENVFSKSNSIYGCDCYAGFGASMLHKSWHLRRANTHTFCYIIDTSTAQQPPCANETVLHVFCTLSSPQPGRRFPHQLFFFFTWLAQLKSR